MIEKKIQTFKVLMVTSFTLWKEFGISVAAPYFIKNIIFKGDHVVGRWFHKRQYESIKNVVRYKYSSKIEEFIRRASTKNTEKIGKNIWMIWWQGIDQKTPKTIIQNVRRIKQLHPNWNINLITKYNYMEFVDIPEHMEYHIRNNDFSMTHISDYLRIVVLEKYGGVYLDCNFFLLESMNYVLQYPFYTIKHGTVSEWHVSKGLWTTGFLAAGRKNILFSFLKEMYEAYFLDYSFVPSYFFIDAIIGLGYENIGAVKKEIDFVPYNNKHYNFINLRGNDLFNYEIWNSVVSDTCVFNVNYKNCFSYEKNGELTFFGYLYMKYERENKCCSGIERGK
ncbi:capsular polysaccharide synthesis protein [Faecalicoccus pleomorphus]|uniref:capsular polysaccharide synthesis protein n=1 Tax=Faecalicoccus pleomorphus TaxID=1323 RepID=UPI00189C35BE|nr:capsular polysaccharide synthesis protein [Faecalicoccus pleomorphus]MDB7984039.1 glycosyltransferase [Faecalicoccus pleomorphus]